MKVVIVGAGNVATVFGRLIVKTQHQVLQVFSRNLEHARLLADELGCTYTNDLTKLNRSADLYLVAIADSAIGELLPTHFPEDKLIVHTAGSVSKETLKNISRRYGVLYPLQSVRKENIQVQSDIPILVDGNTEEVVQVIEQFASDLFSTVSRANDEQRLQLHLAAVIVSNFANQLYTLAAAYCSKEGIDFKMLHPLIEETALRLRLHPPAEVQTGPAIRKDMVTIEKHTRMLAGYPSLAKVYTCITETILHS